MRDVTVATNVFDVTYTLVTGIPSPGQFSLMHP